MPRACRPTAAGRQILEFAGKMEEHATAIERLALTEHLPMHGTVTISVPPVLANNFYANHLYAFAQMHPGIRLSVFRSPVVKRISPCACSAPRSRKT